MAASAKRIRPGEERSKSPNLSETTTTQPRVKPSNFLELLRFWSAHSQGTVSLQSLVTSSSSNHQELKTEVNQWLRKQTQIADAYLALQFPQEDQKQKEQEQAQGQEQGQPVPERHTVQLRQDADLLVIEVHVQKANDPVEFNLVVTTCNLNNEVEVLYSQDQPQDQNRDALNHKWKWNVPKAATPVQDFQLWFTRNGVGLPPIDLTPLPLDNKNIVSVELHIPADAIEEPNVHLQARHDGRTRLHITPPKLSGRRLSYNIYAAYVKCACQELRLVLETETGFIWHAEVKACAAHATTLVLQNAFTGVPLRVSPLNVPGGQHVIDIAALKLGE